MRKLFCIGIFAFLLNDSFSQIELPLIKQGSNLNIPVYTQDAIDLISDPAQGFMVFNESSGCINYFLRGNWFSICGECIPEPTLPKIDSISVIGSKTTIFFNENKDTIKVSIQGKQFISISKSIEFTMPVTRQTEKVAIAFCNTCGCVDTAIAISWERVQISEIETISIGGKNIKTRKYNNVRWMCEDFIPENQKVIEKNAPHFITISKDACPAGWKIPSASDWEELFILFEGNMSELFLPASNDNISLHLEKGGVLELKSRKWLVKGEYGSYWCSDFNKGKQKLVNISDLGYIMPEEDPSLLAIPLRCVKYEK